MSNKLKAFIAMLGSDQPGEVVNAAAMLVKHLKADGKDLHWLSGLAVGEKPAASSQHNPFDDMRFMFRIAELERENLGLRSERQRQNGEISRLRHELKMLQQAAMMNGGTTGPQTATAQAARQQNRNPGWDGNPFGDTRGAQRLHWADMAEYCIIHGGQQNCLSMRELDFLDSILSLSRSINLSYRQSSWLEDIYDRIRRVEAAKGY